MKARVALAIFGATFGIAAFGQDAANVDRGGCETGPLEQQTDLLPEPTRQFVRSGVSVMPPVRKTEINDAELAALAACLAPRTRSPVSPGIGRIP